MSTTPPPVTITVAVVEAMKRTLYRVSLPEETRGDIIVAGLSSVAILAAHLGATINCPTDLARDMGDYASAYNLKFETKDPDG